MAHEKQQLAVPTPSSENTARVVNLHPDQQTAVAQRPLQQRLARVQQRLANRELEYYGRNMAALAFFGNNINDYLPDNTQATNTDLSEESLNSASQPHPD